MDIYGTCVCFTYAYAFGCFFSERGLQYTDTCVYNIHISWKWKSTVFGTVFPKELPKEHWFGKGLKSTFPSKYSFLGLETSRVYKEKQREKKYTSILQQLFNPVVAKLKN